jgi:hypothetical protein
MTRFGFLEGTGFERLDPRFNACLAGPERIERLWAGGRWCEGRLVSCEHLARRVARTEHDGTRTVLAERWQGKRFNSPNDVVVRSDGGICSPIRATAFFRTTRGSAPRARSAPATSTASMLYIANTGASHSADRGATVSSSATRARSTPFT